MMGSPFYYDSLFDDGPGDVVFHDCMWSGICTCCIQLLHQDSFCYINESPDLRVNSKQQHQQQQQQQKVNDNNNNNNNTSICNQNISICINNNINTSPDKAPSSSATSISPDQASSTSTSSPDKAPSSSVTSISPDHTASSTSTSPDTASTLSNSTSPKPVRRREHNDSERKRRDHLRNAFNFLRDQVPRFKAINKKPPRIQILHEATLYVQRIMKESEDLERRLEDERAKHEKFQNLY